MKNYANLRFKKRVTSIIIFLFLAPIIGMGQIVIPQCIDFFETDNSVYEGFDPAVSGPPIPADFFGPGSEPFTGPLFLEGDPLDPLSEGTTDTKIVRQGPIIFPGAGFPETAPVEIEIVELSLQSVQPITVVVDGQETLWDVRVDLSDLDPPPPPGQMIVTRTHPNGGTFTGVLPVQPKFIFVRVDGPPTEVVFDTGLEGRPFVNLDLGSAPWVSNPPPSCAVPVCPDFIPGVQEVVTGVERVDLPVSSTEWNSLWRTPSTDGDGDGVSECDGDCNDGDATVFPGAEELCDGVDNDCDGSIDEGLVFQDYYPDDDNDGYGTNGTTPTFSCMPVPGSVTNNDDCDDGNPLINPEGTEICNGLDDDCDGSVDEGFTADQLDEDSDGDGVCDASDNCPDDQNFDQADNDEDGHGTECDCDDNDPDILAELAYYADSDGDGFGTDATSPTLSCVPLDGHILRGGDCDDGNPLINPDGTEICNDLDDDCDTEIDECNPDEVCVDGACEPCPAGTAACDGQCVDLDSDPQNCGDCATFCGPGETCVEGFCQPCEAEAVGLFPLLPTDGPMCIDGLPPGEPVVRTVKIPPGEEGQVDLSYRVRVILSDGTVLTLPIIEHPGIPTGTPHDELRIEEFLAQLNAIPDSFFDITIEAFESNDTGCAPAVQPDPIGYQIARSVENDLQALLSGLVCLDVVDPTDPIVLTDGLTAGSHIDYLINVLIGGTLVPLPSPVGHDTDGPVDELLYSEIKAEFEAAIEAAEQAEFILRIQAVITDLNGCGPLEPPAPVEIEFSRALEDALDVLLAGPVCLPLPDPDVPLVGVDELTAGSHIDYLMNVLIGGTLVPLPNPVSHDTDGPDDELLYSEIKAEFEAAIEAAEQAEFILRIQAVITDLNGCGPLEPPAPVEIEFSRALEDALDVLLAGPVCLPLPDPDVPLVGVDELTAGSHIDYLINVLIGGTPVPLPNPVGHDTDGPEDELLYSEIKAEFEAAIEAAEQAEFILRIQAVITDINGCGPLVPIPPVEVELQRALDAALESLLSDPVCLEGLEPDEPVVRTSGLSPEATAEYILEKLSGPPIILPPPIVHDDIDGPTDDLLRSELQDFLDLVNEAVVEMKVQVKVTDSEGCVSEIQEVILEVIKEDLTPPEIFCPPDLTIEWGDPTDPGEEGECQGGSCVVPDNAQGTVDMPVPIGCPYLGQLEIVDGLPAGTAILIDAALLEFLIPPIFFDPSLGGLVPFTAIMQMDMEGTGTLAAFSRSIFMEVSGEMDLAPRTPGDPVQTFDTEMIALQGEIFGDPDFEFLRIEAGNDFGMPSPGQTTLTQLPGGNFNVDSFFDITYRIEFQGAPGSVLEGFGGTTQSQTPFVQGDPCPDGEPADCGGEVCEAPDNGTGTVDLPAQCPFDGLFVISDGLPAGTTITVEASMNIAPTSEPPVGGLGGVEIAYEGEVNMQMTGTGSLAGFSRTLSFPVEGQMEQTQGTQGDADFFQTEILQLFGGGEIFGDPDFDILQIEAGSSFGLPSPGQTTLTELPTGNFNVDSFFDIEYRIEFQGAPGSILEGFGGETLGQGLFIQGDPCQEGIPSATAEDDCDPNPTVTFSDNEIITGECPIGIIIERTWTATDDAGNAETCLQIINVTDLSPPDIICPPDITIEWGDPEDPSATGEPSVTDNCDPNPLVFFTDNVILTGACPIARIIERTWITRDGCGNVASCLQIIRVTDLTPPVLLCPPGLTIEWGDPDQPPVTGVPTVTDNCDPDPLVTFLDNVIVTGACPIGIIIERTWKAVDICDNSSTCLQIINVTDLTPPTFTAPGNTTLEWPDEFNIDPVPPGVPQDPRVDPSCLSVEDQFGPAEPLWFLDLPAGVDVMQSTAILTIDIFDLEPIPVTMTGPVEVTRQASQDLVIIPLEMTAMVLEGTVPGIGLVKVRAGSTRTINPDVQQSLGTITGLPADNTQACSFFDVFIELEIVTPAGPLLLYNQEPIPMGDTIDRVPPQATYMDLFTADLNVGLWTSPFAGQGQLVGFLLDAVHKTVPIPVQDNCDPLPTVNFSDALFGPFPGACETGLWVLERTWTAVDDCGNTSDPQVQLISFTDFTPPDIDCPAEITIEWGDPELPGELGECVGGSCVVPDNGQGTADIPAPLVCSYLGLLEILDGLPVGTTILIDAQLGQIISPPLFLDPLLGGVVPFDAIMEMQMEGTGALAGFNRNILMEVQGQMDLAPRTPGDPVQTFDTEIISLQGEIFGDPDFDLLRLRAGFDFGLPSPGHTTLTQLPSGNFNVDSFFDIHYEIDFQGAPGSILEGFAGSTQAINRFVQGCTSGVPSATATDNCDPDPDISFEDNVIITGACPIARIIERTWTATDLCENSSTCVQIINVTDLTPPVLDCPPEITIEWGEPDQPPVTGVPTVTDNCDPDPLVTFLDNVIVTGACPIGIIIERTWKAVDICDNSSTCLQIINVTDLTPPTFTAPGNTTLEWPDEFNIDPVPPGIPQDPRVDPSCLSVEDQFGPAEPLWFLDLPAGVDVMQSTAIVTIDIVGIGAIPVTMKGPVEVTRQASQDLTLTGPEMCDAVQNGINDVIPTEITQMVLEGNVPGFGQTTLRVGPTVTTSQDVQQSLGSINGQVPADNTLACSFFDVFFELEIVTPAGPLVLYNQEPIRVRDTIDRVPPLAIYVHLFTAGLNVGLWTSPIPGQGQFVGFLLDAVHKTVPIPVEDNCDPLPTVNFSDALFGPYPGACETGLWVLERTWTAVDDCGNTSDPQVQLISFTDFTPPDIDCPAEITISSGDPDQPIVTGEALVNDNCDPDPDLIFNDDVISTGPCSWKIERTWTSTDLCDNSSSCLQVITVLGPDDILPVIDCPPDVVIQSGDPTDPSATGMATATDNCDLDPDVTFVDAVEAGDCDDESVITRIWKATDANGNTTYCLQMITVIDDRAPEIECPPNVTLSCEESTEPENTGVASGTDAADSDVDITYFDVSDRTDDGSCSDYTYKLVRVWYAIDECGNSSYCKQSIMVVDTTPPTITCPAALTVEPSLGLPEPDFSGGTVSDNCDDNVAVTHVSDVSDGNSEPETVTRTYMATDACGNSAICTQTIIIDDQTPPFIECPLEIVDFCLSGVPLPDPSLVVVNSDCSAAVSHVGDVSDGESCPETITRTYLVEDECGNSTTCTQLIIVHDLIPPSITCPAPVSVECIEDVPAVDILLPLTGDNCDGTVTVTHEGDTSDGMSCPETITRTYRATDACGNITDCTQTITVNDITPPEITCPALVTVECIEDVPVPDILLPLASDNCEAGVVITHEGDMSDGNSNPETITRTYRATDACDNTSECTQTIIVNDATPPSFSCPDDITQGNDSGLCSAVMSYNTPSASDGCGPATVVCTPASGSVFPVGSTTVTCVATDAAGNNASCTFILTVNDVDDPVITCPSDAITCEEQTDPEFTGTATATDNCPSVLIDFEDGPMTDTGEGVLEFVRTWTATDDAGKVVSCDQLITIDCGPDCSAFETAPVDLSKSFAPVNGVQDRVQLKWYKASPKVKYTDEDAAMCDIKAWPIRNLDPQTGNVVGPPIQDPDTIDLVDKKKTYPDDSPRSIFKWPLRFRADGANNTNRVEPNKRYRWKVRCECGHSGDGPESPWSDEKIFNTLDFDPTTGIYTPLPGAQVAIARYDNLMDDDYEMKTYPNPTEGIFYIDTDLEDYTLEVYDLKGQMVYMETRMKTGITELDLQEAPNGMYLLKMYNNSAIMTKRITIQR